MTSVSTSISEEQTIVNRLVNLDNCNGINYSNSNNSRKFEASSYVNEINNGKLINNLPVITGYYGKVLRKKKHAIFGSYWSKEYCLLQSNIFLCHELKYPFRIKKSISVASIVKCEISKIDPCVFFMTINNENNHGFDSKSINKSPPLDIDVNKNYDQGKNQKPPKSGKKTCLFMILKRTKRIKIKCVSAVDAQKWTFYINNTIKNWNSNKNCPKSLFNGSQYIEKTVAQELLEKTNRKVRKILIQASLAGITNIIREDKMKNLYRSFYKLKMNSLLLQANGLDPLKDEDKAIQTSNYEPLLNTESSFRRDLILINRKIIAFKIERGFNQLKIIQRKKLSIYWNIFKRLTQAINSNNNYHGSTTESIEIQFSLILLRKTYQNWRNLTRKIIYYGKKNEKKHSTESILSTSSILTNYNTNQTTTSSFGNFTPNSSFELVSTISSTRTPEEGGKGV
ncbi:PH domain-containing protein [Cryptosporidium felis]|nr:PH domain-containing protein [Cryptosporidium felis]